MSKLNLNAFASISNDQRRALVEYLEPKYGRLRHNEPVTLRDPDLLLGMEWLLQSLGAEGYEYT